MLKYFFNLTSIVSVVHAEDTFADATKGGIQEYLANLYSWSIGVAGMLAIIMIIWAGYIYITSAGSSDGNNKAKEMIISALAGLIFLLAARLFLSTLGIQ